MNSRGGKKVAPRVNLPSLRGSLGVTKFPKKSKNLKHVQNTCVEPYVSVWEHFLISEESLDPGKVHFRSEGGGG